jgi:biotin carboxylase
MKILETMIFPLVVKPVDNMGARGCRMVRSIDELLPALTSAAENSRSGRVIVEEYMEGPEFSLDALVYDGTLTICGFADRHIYYPPYFIEMGHTMPTAFGKKAVQEVISVFSRGVKALGLTCGAAKGDIKLTPNGAMIGEIAARLSGGYMSGWTFPYASGLNLTKEALRVAAGERPKALEDARIPLHIADAPFTLYDIPCKSVCAERAWISISGAVKEITGVERAAKEPEVHDVFTRSGSGDEVSFPRNNVQKCGNVVALSKTRAKADAAALKAVRDVVIRLAPHNGRTDAFLCRAGEDAENGFPPDAFTLSPETRAALIAETAALGIIPKDTPVSKAVPAALLPVLGSLKDWNSRTLGGTISVFDALCPRHEAFDAREFWESCVRGGLQGMLYYSDSKVMR